MAAILIALLCCSLIQRIVFTLASLIPRPRRPPMGDLPTIQVFVAARDEEAAFRRSWVVWRGLTIFLGNFHSAWSATGP